MEIKKSPKADLESKTIGVNVQCVVHELEEMRSHDQVIFQYDDPPVPVDHCGDTVYDVPCHLSFTYILHSFFSAFCSDF